MNQKPAHPLLVASILAAAVPPWIPALAAEATTIAFVTDRPSTRGTWGPLEPHRALKLAAGVILTDYVGRRPELKLIDWLSTAGTSGTARSGLYIFQATDPWQQWRELIEADVFVDFDASPSGLSTIAVHTAKSTRDERIEGSLGQPKKTIARLVRLVFENLPVSLSPEMEQELGDPETKGPELFLKWAAWIGHTPNYYNDNPWAGPNKSAAAIINGDPDFIRGLAWALPIRLKPVAARSGSGALKKRPANPVDFDNHVLSVLNSKYAPQVIPSYQKRLEDPHLLADSLKILAASEIHFAPAEVEEEEEDELEVGQVKAVRQVQTTPLIRRNVCLALSGNKNPRVVETLLTVLGVDETVMVREAAAESLGGWASNNKVVAGLDKATQEDKDASVRLAAFRSLAKLKSLDEQRLTRALNDAAAEVKSFAFSTLAGQKGATTRVQELVKAAMQADDESLRIQALEMAGAVFDDVERIQTIVAAALRAKSSRERLAALRLVSHYRMNALSGATGKLVSDAEPAVRALAVRTTTELDPETINAVLAKVGDDPDARVQEEVARLCARRDDGRAKLLLKKLLRSKHQNVRHAASNAVYLQAGQDRKMMVRPMLVDPVMRVNFAAIRLITKLRDESLYPDLVWATEHHSNEYVRTRALKALDRVSHPVVHDLCLRLLGSPYWVVRLHAADILIRRARPEDAETLAKALNRNSDRWLRLTLEDAQCKSQGKPIPERTRLRLGQRDHLEGGELPNGWQLWQGYIPEDPGEARKLVDEGYRFGRVLSVPADSSLWSMFSWEDTKGRMDAYLLHFRKDIERLEESAPYLNHIMLFDEPHGLYGGWAIYKIRAFLLECGRPDLVPRRLDHQSKLPPELRRPYQYWSAKVLGELSNFIVGLCRMTLGRQYPDIKWFPQTMTHYGNATADTFDVLDADGDYSWRYDNSNLFGHYSKTAVMRAIRPRQPACMVTWMGWIRPAVISLDRVFTDTKYPDGPWRPRYYMGTRAALALYAGGVEAGFFNHVGYDPISAKGRDIGGVPTFPLTPFSPALSDVITKRMMKGDRAFWQRKYKDVEGTVTAEAKPVTAEDAMDEGAEAEGEDEEAVADFVAEAEGTKRVTIEDLIKERYGQERQKHFMNAMVGCSWMNIFNCDSTRAMSNLPRLETPHGDTLLIFSRGTNWNSDSAAFVMPAVAFAGHFDLCPTYDCLKLVDLMRYDTIMLIDGFDGVTSTLVRQVNEWLRQKQNGLLYVCGDLNTKRALFPELTFDRLGEKFPWEGEATVVAAPQAEEPVLNRKGEKTGKTRRVAVRMEDFRVAGSAEPSKDDSARLRYTWRGNVDPLITHGGETVLARWKAPAGVPNVVLFEGVAAAGPAYTEALEKIVLQIDRERGSTVCRNRYWGHVVLENDQFVVDVATSGYRALQAVRPREHRGVDIITGVINPSVKHNECALILKDYVGPYAGGKADWAVMAASELKGMTVADASTLRVHSRGVTRVTHIGDQSIALKNADAYEQVENQLHVWERMWKGERTYSVADVPGGKELHFWSKEPVEVVVGARD